MTVPAGTPSSLSLEAELGCALFERVAKARVRLTAAGRQLYDFCAPFFENLPGVVRALRAGEVGGVLRVTSGSLVVRGLLPDWIRRLSRARPDIAVQVEEHAAPALELLASGQADLLVDFVPSVAAGFIARQVGLAHTFLAVPAAHQAARRGRPTLHQLRGEPFVGYAPGTVHHALQRQALEQAGLDPARGLAATNVDAILAFVRAGLGYSLVPWLDPRGPRVPGVVARRQTGPGATFPILAVWRGGAVPNPLVGGGPPRRAAAGEGGREVIEASCRMPWSRGTGPTGSLRVG